MYPADDMTMKELEIACYAAQNIIDRLDAGAMIQRWQISAIVKASEELASVYTSMSAGEYDDGEMEDDMYYDEYGIPNMYEEVELDEGFKEKIKGVIRREKEKEYPLLQNRRDVAATKAGTAYAAGDQKKGDRYMKWRSDNMKKEVEIDEETDYEVEVEGLPTMYVKGNSPSEVKAGLRKVVKNPDMIKGIERMTKTSLQKIFRNKASGKDETEE
jgi:hypothetical protein